LKSDNSKTRHEILVVDDELLIRDLLFDFFSAQGFTIHLAENGKKALEMIDSLDIKAAIIDLKMPELDGVELTAMMHKHKPLVPVIIMTAYPSMDSAIEAIKHGVFDYVVKPFKIADLHETVKLAIKEYETRVSSGYMPAANNKQVGIVSEMKD